MCASGPQLKCWWQNGRHHGSSLCWLIWGRGAALHGEPRSARVAFIVIRVGELLWFFAHIHQLQGCPASLNSLQPCLILQTDTDCVPATAPSSMFHWAWWTLCVLLLLLESTRSTLVHGVLFSNYRLCSAIAYAMKKKKNLQCTRA